MRPAAALLALAAVLAAACSPAPAATPASAGPPVSAGPLPSASASSAAAATGTAAPSPTVELTPSPVGFAFAADDVLAYYGSVGYACSQPGPSTQAAGYTVRSCDHVDAAGRNLTIAVVTDPGGSLGDAFASVATADPTGILDPVDALDPLSGFLGAMLGSGRAAPQVQWLAAHAGDAYAETSDAGLRIATYTPTADDHSTIFLELADQAYLDAPRP